MIPRRQLVWGPLALAVLVNQVGTWTLQLTWARLGQALIVPGIVVAVTLLGGRWRFTTLAAFGIYWCGDLLPMVTSNVWRDLAMLALFTVGHVLVIIATRDRPARFRTQGRITMITAAALTLIAMAAALVWVPWLAPWIAMYGAVSAILVGRLAAFSTRGLAGGCALLVSNVILATRLMTGSYGGLLPLRGIQLSSSLTMLLYAAGLALIALTVVPTRAGRGR